MGLSKGRPKPNYTVKDSDENTFKTDGKKEGTSEPRPAPAAPAPTQEDKDTPQRPRTPKKHPLKRPRGKRGGAKNRRTRKDTNKQPNEKHGHGMPEHAKQISLFHALEKRIAASKDPAEIAKLKLEQQQLGGLEAYQKASLTGGAKTKGGETGKWFAKTWQELYGKDDEIRFLDVGAIHGTTYDKFPWINTTSIDLNAMGPGVIQADFFKFPIPREPDQLYDVVGLSLVLNFVGDLQLRAEMLRRAHHFLKPEGHIFVVLPLACLNNSRYMDHERFRGILATLGWEPVAEHDSAKLTHWIFKRTKGDNKTWKREEVRGGVDRNNFCIVVKW